MEEREKEFDKFEIPLIHFVAESVPFGISCFSHFNNVWVLCCVATRVLRLFPSAVMVMMMMMIVVQVMVIPKSATKFTRVFEAIENGLRGSELPSVLLPLR